MLSVNDFKIASRYAKALFSLAQTENKQEAIYQDLKTLSELMVTSGELSDFIHHPRILQDKVQEMLKLLFEGKIEALTLRFLHFLAYKRQLANIEMIIERFADFHFEATKILRAEIISAEPLTQDQTKTLMQRLKIKFQRDMICRYVIDPVVIGGFLIKVKDEVYDYSLRGQLDRFRYSSIHA